MSDAYDELRKDWCDEGDLPCATCAHCNARPGDALRRLDRPWTFDGQHVVRRSGRDVFPSIEHPTTNRPHVLRLDRAEGGRCGCGQPTRDNAYICDACLDELAKALGDVPWLIEQLDTTITKSRGIDYSATGSHGPTAPLAHKDVDDDGDAQADAATALPFHLAASDAAIALRRTLGKWVRFCTEESIRHQSFTDALPYGSAPSMARWLLWRVDGLALNDMGPDAASEITAAVAKAHAVIDRPAERRYVGPCECGRDLYAKPGTKVTTCPACERQYDVEAMGAWMRAGVSGRLVTAFEGATLLGRFDLPVAQKTIDKWHERKRLVDHGTDAAGRRLYLIDDLIALAARNDTRTA